MHSTFLFILFCCHKTKLKNYAFYRFARERKLSKLVENDTEEMEFNITEPREAINVINHY